MRVYSKIDLIRYHRFAQEHPELKPVDMVDLYDKTYREIPEEEKLANIKKFFGKIFDEIKKENDT